MMPVVKSTRPTQRPKLSLVAASFLFTALFASISHISQAQRKSINKTIDEDELASQLDPDYDALIYRFNPDIGGSILTIDTSNHEGSNEVFVYGSESEQPLDISPQASISGNIGGNFKIGWNLDLGGNVVLDSNRRRSKKPKPRPKPAEPPAPDPPAPDPPTTHSEEPESEPEPPAAPKPVFESPNSKQPPQVPKYRPPKRKPPAWKPINKQPRPPMTRRPKPVYVPKRPIKQPPKSRPRPPSPPPARPPTGPKSKPPVNRPKSRPPVKGSRPAPPRNNRPKDRTYGPVGGKLDEGTVIAPGGGFQGCGEAPLNMLTPRKKSQEYIIGGEREKYGEFPQYIHLEVKLGQYVSLCGGTLVSDQHVITAAHCVKNGDNLLPSKLFTVIFGESDMQRKDAHELRVGVKHICVSQKYTAATLRFDWALITLNRKVEFTDYIQPACLPRYDQYIATSGPNSTCYLVGAGAIAMNQDINNPNQPVPVSSKVVNKLHADNVSCGYWGFGDLDVDRVCYTRANNLVGDSCVGDSGGPILCLDQNRRWTLMASVSYGSKFCEHSRVAVYARTRTLLPSIEDQCSIRMI